AVAGVGRGVHLAVRVVARQDLGGIVEVAADGTIADIVHMGRDEGLRTPVGDGRGDQVAGSIVDIDRLVTFGIHLTGNLVVQVVLVRGDLVPAVGGVDQRDGGRAVGVVVGVDRPLA